MNHHCPKCKHDNNDAEIAGGIFVVLYDYCHEDLFVACPNCGFTWHEEAADKVEV